MEAKSEFRLESCTLIPDWNLVTVMWTCLLSSCLHVVPLDLLSSLTNTYLEYWKWITAHWNNLTIIHGMWRRMYVCMFLNHSRTPAPILTKLAPLIALDPPMVIGGSGSRPSKVKGHLGVKSWNLQESSTEVTRGHFKVTTVSRKSQHRSWPNLHQV